MAETEYAFDTLKIQGGYDPRDHNLAVSAPVKGRLILSSSYVGYHGGLELLEDIYTYVLKQFN